MTHAGDPGASARSVEAVFREEHGRLLATLARRFGDLELAEDVASEAIEAALTHWPREGVPRHPGAWLVTTAKRRAIDRLRRDRTQSARLGLLLAEKEREDPTPPTVLEQAIPDERLQLFFACTHPALSPADRTALTLRYLAGLTTVEVARAFLVPVETMAKRLTRSKTKIRDARIPFRVPDAEDLPGRLSGVLQVIYSIFTEGYVATSGPELQRLDLAEEAVRLARLVHQWLPDEREAAGLLGLLLLTHARRDARTDPDGEPILLDSQDRSLWDREMITEGTGLAEQALTGGPPGPYGVQAAIAALHDEADSEASTDWPQIVALYEVLQRISPSPVVEVNLAVAMAMRDGAQAGLVRLDRLAAESQLRDHGPLHAARADLLARLGRHTDAAQAYRRALELAGTEPERRTLQRRLAEASGEDSSD